MGVFKDMLGSQETLFKNPIALDYDFMPKTIDFRESEQRSVIAAIMPLMHARNGRNLFISGIPGIGKTLAVKAVLGEIEDETEEIVPVYVNCWNKNTSYKVMVGICEELGYPFTQNKKTEDLFKIIKERINQSAGVFVFDEIDKAEDLDFLYMILEEIYKSSVILITNHKEWAATLDVRIKSRLTPESLEFRAYTLDEVKAILSQRAGVAFYENVFPESLIAILAQKTYAARDIRTGLFLMREAATFAEQRGSKVVEREDVDAAIAKTEDFKSKGADEIDEEHQEVLALIRQHDGERIGTLYENYQSEGKSVSYKTFQRRIARLEKGRYIRVEHVPGGSEGKTSIIHYTP